MWFLLLVIAGVGVGLSKKLDGVATRVLLVATLLLVGLYGLNSGAF
jgi:hypothetical protein